MGKINILDSETFKEVSCYFNSIGVHLDETGVIANANLCYIISNYCNGKITATQILRAYDYVTDVLCGRQPRIVVSVPKDERVIWTKMLLSDQGFGYLTSDELDFFSFCIVYSFFIYGINEETGKMEQVIYEFTAMDRIIKEYNYHKNSGFWKFERKSCSDTTKGDINSL